MRLTIAAPFLLIGSLFVMLGAFIAGRRNLDIDESLIEDVHYPGVEGVGTGHHR